MLANLLLKPGTLKLEEVSIPKPAKGEILVRVKAALTCGTDLKAFMRGHPMIPMPTVFGHEFSGIVEQAGRGVKKFSRGSEIMAVHSAPCDRCYFCRKKLFNLCEKIMETKVLGAFAEFILLPKHIVKHNVFLKPEALSFAEAAFLEPLSCVVHSINSAGISRGDTVVIIGAGPIGLLHLMVLKTKGLKIVVVEKRSNRIKKARELKADCVVNPEKDDVIERVMKYTGNNGADTVFECTGVPDVWESSVWMLRKGGTAVLFGGCRQGSQVTYDAGRIHYDEITLKGAFHFTPGDVVQAYKLLVNGKIKVKGLVSGEYPLHKLKTVFDRLAAGKGIKYAIIP